MSGGRIAELHRWPVKSLRGERIIAARLDERGMAGDRAFALLDQRPNHSGKVLTVRQNPTMLGWSSSYGDDPDPATAPTLHSPDGTAWSWKDPRLADELAESLSIPLSLHEADGQQDRGPTVLVTFEASRAGLEAELGQEVDLARFRPNLHLKADFPAFDEESWGPGTTITTGSVTLEITGEQAGVCIRCTVPSWDPRGRERWPQLQSHLIHQHDNKFGLIMRATRPGTVREGDTATVSPVPSGAL